jgi:hypothetical protein
MKHKDTMTQRAKKKEKGREIQGSRLRGRRMAKRNSASQSLLCLCVSLCLRVFVLKILPLRTGQVVLRDLVQQGAAGMTHRVVYETDVSAPARSTAVYRFEFHLTFIG